MVSDARKDQMRAYIARRRDERKRSGLCTECGEPTDGRHSRCFNCRLKNAAAQARYQRRRTEWGYDAWMTTSSKKP